MLLFIPQERTKTYDTHQMVTSPDTTMHSTASACSGRPLEMAVRVLDGRWKVPILFQLFTAPTLRFSKLQRAIPGISQKMLIERLRDLEADGIVSRTVHPVVPPKVEYGLTDRGRGLLPALRALHLWAEQL
jgi:DNA-binding HxlR family transcriptional regulator